MTAKLKTKSERKNVCHTASNLSIKIFSFSPLEAIFRRFIDSHRSWFGLFLLLLVAAVDSWRFEPSALADHVCKSLPRPMNGIRFHILIDGFRVNSGEIFSSSACEPHVVHHCSLRSSWGDDWWCSGGVERAGWRENQRKHARNIGLRACSVKKHKKTDNRRSPIENNWRNRKSINVRAKKCLTHKSAIQPKRDDLENENLFSETGEKITKCLIENRFWYQRDENGERGWSQRKVPKHLNPAAAIVQQLNLTPHLNSTDSWKALWLNELAFQVGKAARGRWLERWSWTVWVEAKKNLRNVSKNFFFLSQAKKQSSLSTFKL